MVQTATLEIATYDDDDFEMSQDPRIVTEDTREGATVLLYPAARCTYL